MVVANNIEKAIKSVKAGNSKVFKNWHEHAGITEDEFIEGLNWLYDDPLYNDGNGSEDGRLKKELGCDKSGIHKLFRSYSEDGDFLGFYDEGNLLWSGTVSISPVDRV